jgi:hypothetical protein
MDLSTIVVECEVPALSGPRLHENRGRSRPLAVYRESWERMEQQPGRGERKSANDAENAAR